MAKALSSTALGASLKRAQHAYRTRIDHDLRPWGLTAPQYAVLDRLSQQPGASNASLARAAFVTPQTMQGIVTKLERDNLIERRPHPHHIRLLEATLTERGSAMLVQARTAVLEVERIIRGAAGTVEQLVNTLINIANTLNRG